MTLIREPRLAEKNDRMPLISAPEAYAVFRKYGRNSSHFVWFLAKLEFFRASNDWVFGFRRCGGDFLIALEPLIPGAPMDYEPAHGAALAAAWAEFVAELRPETAAFVSVYAPFAELLRTQGFDTTKVGEEPWVDLQDCIPTGNSGKGVRAARNQAIHAGVTIEEWPAAEVASDPAKQQELARLLDEWRSRRVVELGGFRRRSRGFRAIFWRIWSRDATRLGGRGSCSR